MALPASELQKAFCDYISNFLLRLSKEKPPITDEKITFEKTGMIFKTCLVCGDHPITHSIIGDHCFERLALSDDTLIQTAERLQQTYLKALELSQETTRSELLYANVARILPGLNVSAIAADPRATIVTADYILSLVEISSSTSGSGSSSSDSP